MPGSHWQVRNILNFSPELSSTSALCKWRCTSGSRRCRHVTLQQCKVAQPPKLLPEFVHVLMLTTGLCMQGFHAGEHAEAQRGSNSDLPHDGSSRGARLRCVRARRKDHRPHPPPCAVVRDGRPGQTTLCCLQPPGQYAPALSMLGKHSGDALTTAGALYSIACWSSNGVQHRAD